jgi:hypothetical protein
MAKPRLPRRNVLGEAMPIYVKIGMLWVLREVFRKSDLAPRARWKCQGCGSTTQKTLYTYGDFHHPVCNKTCLMTAIAKVIFGKQALREGLEAARAHDVLEDTRRIIEAASREVAAVS